MGILRTDSSPSPTDRAASRPPTPPDPPAQATLRPRIGYLASQPSVNERMRAILVDWLVEIAYKYRQTQETLTTTHDSLGMPMQRA